MIEAQIKAALIRFTNGIKASDGAEISAGLTQVDALLAENRGRLDPRLEHFLEGRSYAKALAWLGEQPQFGAPASPPGGCNATRNKENS